MTLRWSYALNQWNSGHDLFVLPRAHETAFKTIAISGFEAAEIEAGSGRWEPLGRRDWIEAYYGSPQALRERMRACGLTGASSYLFDPAKPVFEEGAFGRSILNPADQDAIVRTVGAYAALLPELGGDTLAVRAMPPLPADRPFETAVQAAAQGWNRAGAIAAEHGVKLVLNLDPVTPLRTLERIATLLDRCDPQAVGLSIDTADLTLVGLDPRSVFARFKDRVRHVQLKNTRYVATPQDLDGPHPDVSMMSAGGEREIERWYGELDDAHGLVDSIGLVSDLLAAGYDGWVVVESDQSPVPATSTMVNGWWLKKRLKPLAA